jgi:uncharacterized protein DUF4124
MRVAHLPARECVFRHSSRRKLAEFRRNRGMESAEFPMGTTAAELPETGIAASVGQKRDRTPFHGAAGTPGGARLCRGLSSIDARSTTKERKAMHRPLLLVLLAAAGLPSLALAAPIYKCAGPTGATVFSQVPCGKDAASVGGSSAATAAVPVADPASDKAALASIDLHCKADSQKVLDNYSAKFAEANASIADLHKRLMVKSDSGAEKDPAVQKEIAAVEGRKTELLGSQDREVAALRNQCQAERNAEIKRQSDRDAARAMVKR